MVYYAYLAPPPFQEFLPRAAKRVSRQLKQRRRRHQRGRQKSNRFSFARASLFFGQFSAVTARLSVSWKCLISRFVEDLSTRQPLSFSFPEIWYISQNSALEKFAKHLTNWTSWKERDKVEVARIHFVSDVSVSVLSKGGHYDRNIFCLRVEGPKPEIGKNLNHTQKT